MDRGSTPLISTNDVSVRTKKTDRYKNQSEMVDFFVAKKFIQSLKERIVLEMKIIKKELQFEKNLKKRLEFICEFSKVTPTFINGSIRKIDKTNISYIEPHRVIIKDKRCSY